MKKPYVAKMSVLIGLPIILGGATVMYSVFKPARTMQVQQSEPLTIFSTEQALPEQTANEESLSAASTNTEAITTPEDDCTKNISKNSTEDESNATNQSSTAIHCENTTSETSTSVNVTNTVNQSAQSGSSTGNAGNASNTNSTSITIDVDH